MTGPASVLVRAVAMVAVAGLVLGAVAAGATPGAAARPATQRVATVVSLELDPFQAIAGETVQARVEVTPGVARRVVLQRRDGGRWKRVDAAQTSAQGAHDFDLVTPGRSSTYRVRAPRAEAGGTAYEPGVSPRRRLTVVAQSVLFRVPDTADAGSSVWAVAEAAPRRAGRPVHLQQRVGGRWTTVDEGVQDVRGLVTWEVPTPHAGRLVHRVVVRPYAGAAAVRSGKRTTTVRER